MRRLLAAACLLPLLVPVACLAQDTEPKGMPQLEFSNPLTLSQVFWLAIIFAALYVMLSRWALPRVGAVLSDRETRIASDLDGARAAKADADAAAQDTRDASRRAHERAQAAINEAIETAKHAAAERAAVMNTALEARLAKAEQAIAEARTEAMGSLRTIAVSTSETMIERLTGKPAASGAVESAVGALIEQRAA
jgi:F-type H+-transporting ATPase subunit b